MKVKKSFIICSLVLVCVLTCALIFGNPVIKNQNVFARGFEGQHIVVVGKGEVEVEPDTIKVSFGLKCRGESLQAGQAKIRENIEQVTNKIKQYNKDAEVYTNYLSSYPVFENGLLAYEFDCCLIAKSKNVADANGLVDAIVDAGATSVHSVNYILTNKEEAYINALVSAKQNAENKVKAIYENAILKGLKEEAVYNYCEGSHGEKIKITAKVNACYQVSLNETNGEQVNIQNKKAFDNKSLATSTQADMDKDYARTLELKNEKLTDVDRPTTLEEIANTSRTSNENKLPNNKSTNLTNATTNDINNSIINTNVQNKEALNEINNAENKNVKEDKENQEENAKEESSTENTKNMNSANENKVVEKENVETKQNKKPIKTNSQTRSIIDANGNVIIDII